MRRRRRGDFDPAARQGDFAVCAIAPRKLGGTLRAWPCGSKLGRRLKTERQPRLFNLQSYPGSLGLSAYASLGVGLAVVNIASSVTAYISPAVTITGLGGSGSLLIDATRNATTKVLGIAGSVSGLIALGSAVAYVSDTSSVQATLGVNVTDSGLFQANSASGAATVGGAGFALIEVDAEHTETMNLATGAGSLIMSANATANPLANAPFTTRSPGTTIAGNLNLNNATRTFTVPDSGIGIMEIVIDAAINSGNSGQRWGSRAAGASRGSQRNAIRQTMTACSANNQKQPRHRRAANAAPISGPSSEPAPQMMATIPNSRFHIDCGNHS